VSGALAQWVGHPLTVPFVVFTVALTIAVLLVPAAPETRPALRPRGVVSGLGAGLLFRGTVGTVGALAPADSRAEALAGLFLAGYSGLTVPVVGLGLLERYTTPRFGLLMFAGPRKRCGFRPAEFGSAARSQGRRTTSLGHRYVGNRARLPTRSSERHQVGVSAT
jgi:hypothetical protein